MNTFSIAAGVKWLLSLFDQLNFPTLCPPRSRQPHQPRPLALGVDYSHSHSHLLLRAPRSASHIKARINYPAQAVLGTLNNPEIAYYLQINWLIGHKF